ncbi:MAG TPA: glycogen/starch synthase [Candidatus Angelobacter sp.]|nr:glycogen/starch synthase [Candidatus Angelobacter sp.]
MFSHECAGLAQAGGLGEAVAGLSKTLALDSKLDISVFLPSHGRHTDPKIRESYHLQEITTFIAQGHRTGVNGSWYNYLAGMEKGSRDGVNYFLAKGLDSVTSKWLDDPIIYDHETTFEKMSLFARTVGSYTEYLISMGRINDLPDLIHANDWHMVPAGVLVKQRLQERGVITPLVFTVHLLSGVTLPWHYASEEWCGIRDMQHLVRSRGSRSTHLKYSQVWQSLCHNSLEKFGCYEADYVTSVSRSYLTRDVRTYVGDAIRGKSGHIYNGCDWDPSSIELSIITRLFPDIRHSLAGETLERWDLRRYLLTNAISQVGELRETEDEIRSSDDSHKDQGRSVEAFQQEGPLVLMTGRLSPQKGVDLLLNAIPLVRAIIPDAKFLLFLLPSNDSRITTTTIETAARYPDNVRVIFGKHPSVYFLSHLAADVYAMPSRSEPFGISALEAMVTGNPVVGTSVGGITETVLDISTSGESGTGILIPPEKAAMLAESIVSLLTVMQIDENTQRGEEDRAGLSRKIPLERIARMVAKNRNLGSRIRENCRKRVLRKFRWANAGQMALNRYDAARSLAAKTLQKSS